MSGRGYLFFYSDVIQSTEGGSQCLVLLIEKEEPGPPPREEDGQIPAAKDSPVYFSIALVSVLDRE